MSAVHDDSVVRMNIVQNLARTEHDAQKRVIHQVDRQVGLVLQQRIETLEQRSAAGHDNAAVAFVPAKCFGGYYCSQVTNATTKKQNH